MLSARKRRYMSIEDFNETGRMIDIFFDNGAMHYTDADKYVKSISNLQANMNMRQRFSVTFINRLFLQMKDKALYAVSEQKMTESRAYIAGREEILEFMIEGIGLGRSKEENLERIIRNFDRLGLNNAAFLMYDEPVAYVPGSDNVFPEEISLRCVIKAGEMYIVPEDRRRCRIKDIFSRDELPPKCRGYAVFSVFCREYIYGVFFSELNDDIYGRGEYIAAQLGRVFYLNDIEQRTEGDICRLQ